MPGNCAVIGRENFARALLGVVRRQILVGKDRRSVACGYDRLGAAGRPVAVDHQTRIRLHDEAGIQPVGQVAADAGNADIPGDVPRAVGLAKSEIVQPARNAPPGMVANEQERRGAGRPLFDNGRWFVRR